MTETPRFALSGKRVLMGHWLRLCSPAGYVPTRPIGLLIMDETLRLCSPAGYVPTEEPFVRNLTKGCGYASQRAMWQLVLVVVHLEPQP